MSANQNVVAPELPQPLSPLATRPTSPDSSTSSSEPYEHRDGSPTPTTEVQVPSSYAENVITIFENNFLTNKPFKRSPSATPLDALPPAASAATALYTHDTALPPLNPSSPLRISAPTSSTLSIAPIHQPPKSSAAPPLSLASLTIPSPPPGASSWPPHHAPTSLDAILQGFPHQETISRQASASLTYRPDPFAAPSLPLSHALADPSGALADPGLAESQRGLPPWLEPPPPSSTPLTGTPPHPQDPHASHDERTPWHPADPSGPPRWPHPAAPPLSHNPLPSWGEQPLQAPGAAQRQSVARAMLLEQMMGREVLQSAARTTPHPTRQPSEDGYAIPTPRHPDPLYPGHLPRHPLGALAPLPDQPPHHLRQPTPPPVHPKHSTATMQPPQHHPPLQPDPSSERSSLSLSTLSDPSVLTGFGTAAGAAPLPNPHPGTQNPATDAGHSPIYDPPQAFSIGRPPTPQRPFRRTPTPLLLAQPAPPATSQPFPSYPLAQPPLPASRHPAAHHSMAPPPLKRAATIPPGMTYLVDKPPPVTSAAIPLKTPPTSNTVTRIRVHQVAPPKLVAKAPTSQPQPPLFPSYPPHRASPPIAAWPPGLAPGGHPHDRSNPRHRAALTTAPRPGGLGSAAHPRAQNVPIIRWDQLGDNARADVLRAAAGPPAAGSPRGSLHPPHVHLQHQGAWHGGSSAAAAAVEMQLERQMRQQHPQPHPRAPPPHHLMGGVLGGLPGVDFPDAMDIIQEGSMDAPLGSLGSHLQPSRAGGLQ